MKDVMNLENIVVGMYISNRNIEDCETCTLGKVVNIELENLMREQQRI